VSADGAYLSGNNMKDAVDNNAMPYIAFKVSNTGKDPKSSDLFKRMYHFYAYNQEAFMQNYHKRSNVETTFSMIKAKFGERVRSKTTQAQVNEALLKVLCHNICVVIQSIYELGIEPSFWTED
jgi:transposase